MRYFLLFVTYNMIIINPRIVSYVKKGVTKKPVFFCYSDKVKRTSFLIVFEARNPMVLVKITSHDGNT
jgi:hypothetical protein